MKFAKTKMLIEVEAETQFGPESAEDMIGLLLKVPAITGVRMVNTESNYRLHEEPSSEFTPFRVDGKRIL